MAVPRKLSSTDTRYVSSDVRANRVVMPDTSVAVDADGFRKVMEATANATTFLGVAMFAASATVAPDTTFVKPRTKVTISQAPQTARVQYAAAAVDGEPLICAAGGAVTPAGASTSPVVGWAVGDVAAAGLAPMKLNR